MKIESIIRRKNGTRVVLDDQVYHFKPTSEDERHIAEVSIRKHIQRFLSIPEGFQPAEIDESHVSPAPVQSSPLNADQPVLGTLAGVQNSDMEIEGAGGLADEELAKATQADPVNDADTDGNGNGDETKEDAGGDHPVTLDREALAEQYKARFKKAPHHKLTAERIKQILDEDEGE